MINKKCPTCIKDFRAKRNSQVYCSKTCAQQNSSTVEKMIKSQKMTSIKKYGVIHPMKSPVVVNNFKKSMKEKYGVEHALQLTENIEKSKETKRIKYGNSNYNNLKKMESTMLKLYGVKNFVYTDEYKEKSKKSCLEKYNVEFSSQAEVCQFSRKITMMKKFLNGDDFKNFTPLFSINDYSGVKDGHQYPFKCNRCNNTQSHYLKNGLRPCCINCDKLVSSFLQKEIYDFLKSILNNDEIILVNNRSVISPKEIDLYLPNKKLAIEFDGLFWHSELSGNKNKFYHLDKTKRCAINGIKLIHIFENEWKEKSIIIKSILSNILGSSNMKRIYARNCEIRNVEQSDSSIFLLQNHIQGNDRSSIRYGLYYNNELVSLMTFNKPRFDKKCDFEMLRFCSKLFTSVVGGANKLFSCFLQKHNPSLLVSYSDRRFFSGAVYEKLNMKFLGYTPPNYHYTKMYKELKSRMNFPKYKLFKVLPVFDATLSEWENMKNNGFDRIWDCGHSKWIFKSSDQ